MTSTRSPGSSASGGMGTVTTNARSPGGTCTAMGPACVPMRVAVVQEGGSPKTIFTKAYRTSVSMTPDGNVPFSLVAEDIVYPAVSAAENDSYVFYVGFDPQSLKSDPKPRARQKR